MENNLVTLVKQDAMSLFADGKGLDDLLARIRVHVDGFAGDVATAKGRKEIASMAYRVAQSKTYIESFGKEVAATAKELPKKIDANRKRIRDTLDEWGTEIRKPLTDWEDAEKRRLERHQERLDRIQMPIPAAWTADAVSAHIAFIESVAIDDTCEEFADSYKLAKSGSLAEATDILAARTKVEAEQEELTRLRREAAEREARDREEAIRLEAVEQQQRESAKREADLREAVAAADRRAAEAEERARREAEEEEKRLEREAQARERDRAHRGQINRAAVSALMEGGMTKETAEQAITLIAKRMIPNVSISY